jgi:hypothetical protein
VPRRRCDAQQEEAHQIGVIGPSWGWDHRQRQLPQGSLQNYRRVAEQHRRVEEALRLRGSRAGGSIRGAAGSETLPTCFSPGPPHTARAGAGTGADTDVRQCSASNAVEHLRELTELLVRGVRTGWRTNEPRTCPLVFLY